MRWSGLRLAAVAAVLVGAPCTALAADTVAELRTRFDTAVASGADADAQACGKKLLADFPEDPSALHVLRVFHENEWKWPRLRASFATQNRWMNDVIDDAAEPDFRCALVESMEDQFAKHDFVKEGGSLYVRQWCRMRAKRWDESIQLGKEFLRRFAESSNVDKSRWVLAVALLARTPPDADAARKHLEWLAADPKRRHCEDAKRRLEALSSGASWIELDDGCPRAAGIGVTAVVTDLRDDDPQWKALDAWRTARNAKVLRFRRGRVASVGPALRKLGPEFVAFAVAPQTLDANFQWEVLDLCRGLDDDPMPDFHFGYLTARDASDLRALADRSFDPRAPDAQVSIVSMDAPVAALAKLDGFLHFGHGSPTRVLSGWTAEQVTAMTLPRAPFVFSGACFNGVTSRSYEPSVFKPRVFGADVHAPHDVIALAWIHAGAAAVVAAIEADRGEMAAQEWALLRETACTLGEAVGMQYRLACMSLPESTPFPRYAVGGPRSLALYDVMLRGATSRVVIGDPAMRVLAKPVIPPLTSQRAVFDAASKSWTASVEVARGADPNDAGMFFFNTLTPSGMSDRGFTERRLSARIEVPADVRDAPAPPTVRVECGGAEVPLLRTFVRHEVWGGKRYVSVQAESASGALAAPGARATFTFAPPPRR